MANKSIITICVLVLFSCSSQTEDVKINYLIHETKKTAQSNHHIDKLSHSIFHNHRVISNTFNQILINDLKEIKFLRGYGFYYYNFETHQILKRIYRNAIQHYNKAISLKIEKLEDEKPIILHELIIQYFIFNKHSKIKQNKIETQIQEIHIKRQNDFIQFLIFVSFLLVSALIIVVYFFILCIKKNKHLSKQTILIENANKELNNSLLEKEVLLKEIHHRFKNNLQLVSSLLSIQANESHSVQSFLNISQSRLHAMALIHENLYREDSPSQIHFNTYLQQLFFLASRTFEKPGQKIELSIECPELILDVQTAIPLGLILNEIICNAFKHAFPYPMSGTISAKFQYVPQEDQAKLIVEDNGIGYSDDFQSDTLGSSIGFKLMKILSLQIQGNIQKIKTSLGTAYEIRFKI